MHMAPGDSPIPIGLFPAVWTPTDVNGALLYSHRDLPQIHGRYYDVRTHEYKISMNSSVLALSLFVKTLETIYHLDLALL